MDPITTEATITVFLADDNIIVREGVRAMLSRHPDIEIVGAADDYDSLIEGAGRTAPNVVVSDIRMPPSFQSEGIDGCKEIRKRHPGTGVVILSQFDDPDYAISLLSEGAAGYAYLLKDHIAEGDQLIAAIRAVASGGSVLDPTIVDAMVRPAMRKGDLDPDQEQLLTLLAAGKPIKAIAAARKTTPAAVSSDVDRLFAMLAQSASAGAQGALRRLRMLHDAIVSREEQGESLSRLLPGGVAEKLLASGRELGESEMMNVTVLMSDIRGYSTISEHADLSTLARQLNTHRAQMNGAIIAEGGTVMQYVGDAVMAVFGAPVPSSDHADRAIAAAAAMHSAQRAVDRQWEADGLPAFPIGIGLSTGEVAAALLGSEERAEYTVVGDVVNLCQRLQQLASAGQTVMSEPTWDALTTQPPGVEHLDPEIVKGRDTPVRPYRVGSVG
ncbi:MAG TPA: adenylate/guanylate cyclase domain-containing protein [Ilumatobacteraceae bacterium]|nr:adenylate/guanylate cyclase domain-containing protein [Ilumatobacteraceae bacterium]HRB01853.1 adenylate/guanylate cyclase domain-containing protein [Ilumatobacteraceae bacterium]